MVVIYILLGISVLVASIFLLAFLWNLRSGQYEDDYTPAIRVLFEDSVSEQRNEKLSEQKPSSKR
jgi:cbb3-type cytochrome oxidase maturation protein